jgi:enoyl-CoA hydratase/carnithine racemase
VDLGSGRPLTRGMQALLEARLEATVLHDLLVTGERVGGAAAVARGLAHAAFPERDLLPSALARAASLAGRDAATLGTLKRGLCAEALAALATPAPPGRAGTGSIQGRAGAGADAGEDEGVTASDLRREIVEQHRALRERFDAIDQLAADFLAGDESVGGDLRERGLALYEVFAAHLRFEDEQLKPALEAAGAEGRRRAERLTHEHRDQRELLEFLSRRLGRDAAPSQLVARELANFVEYLRRDMAHEEGALLDAAAPGAPH